MNSSYKQTENTSKAPEDPHKGAADDDDRSLLGARCTNCGAKLGAHHATKGGSARCPRVCLDGPDPQTSFEARRTPAAQVDVVPTARVFREHARAWLAAQHGSQFLAEDELAAQFAATWADALRYAHRIGSVELAKTIGAEIAGAIVHDVAPVLDAAFTWARNRRALWGDTATGLSGDSRALLEAVAKHDRATEGG